MLLMEPGFVGYIALDYWWLGLSWQQAKNDYIYALWDSRSVSLLFLSQLLQAKARLESDDLSLAVKPGDDHITAVCKVSMYVQLTTEAMFVPRKIFDAPSADPGSTEERLEAFVQACRDVYASLDPSGPQRRLLDALQPRIAANVTSPTLLRPTECDEERARAFQERETLAASLPRRAATAEQDVDGAYAKYGLLPTPLEKVRAADLPEAIRQGRVVRFDATEMLPKEIFNMSIDEVARLHENLAEGVPMYRQNSVVAPNGTGWESLKRYAERIELLRGVGRLHVPEFRPWRPAEMSEEERRQMHHLGQPPTWWLGLLNAIIALLGGGLAPAEAAHGVQLKATQCAVNIRRLPRLPANFSMEAALGNPPWLERAQSLLWLGAVGDCWHYDDPDNLVIAVRGEIHVTVYDPQYSDLLRAHGGRGCWSRVINLPKKFTDPAVVEANEWLKKVPFYTIKLETGQGVVIPSRAYHSLAVPDVDRIMLNAFLHPKFGALFDAPAAKHSFYRRELQSEEYAALRHLKTSAAFRLWDTKRLGGWFEMTKLELL